MSTYTIRTSWMSVRTGFFAVAGVMLASLIWSFGVGPALAQEHEGGIIPYQLKKGEAGEIATEPTTDRIGMLKNAPPNSRTVWVYDPAAFDVVTKIYRINGDTGRVEGEIDTGLLTNMVLSIDNTEVYLYETWYSRFSRGDRDDFIRIFDPDLLESTADIDTPEGHFLVMVMQQMADITTDGRYYLYYQFSPAPGVGVTDLKNKKFVTTIDIPDCVLIFPSGPKSFVMECRDGTLLNVSFDASGKATFDQTKSIRSEDEYFHDTPAFSRTAGKIFFVAYDGTIYPIDISSGKANAGKPWEMFSADEVKAGWAPGGWSNATYHRPSNRLLVLADVRPAWTHIYSSAHVMVYDASSGKRLDDISLHHAVLSLNVSQDSDPNLYLLDNHTQTLHVYSLDTGRYLHSVDEMGHDPYIIVVSEQ